MNYKILLRTTALVINKPEIIQYPIGHIKRLIHTVINACKIFFKETLLAILFTLYSSYLKSDVMIEMKFMADFIKKRMHIKT